MVKSGLILQTAGFKTRRPGSAPPLFGEQHAADVVGVNGQGGEHSGCYKGC